MRKALVQNARRVAAGEAAAGLNPARYPTSISGNVAAGTRWTTLLAESLVSEPADELESA